MADIKTKDSNKGTIKTLDKAAIATQRMKQSYIAAKDKAEHSVNANTNSAEEYASDKMESGIEEVVHDGAYVFDKAGSKSLETTKENLRSVKRHTTFQAAESRAVFTKADFAEHKLCN